MNTSMFPHTMSKIKDLDEEYKRCQDLTYFEREQAALALKAKVEYLLHLIECDLRIYQGIQDRKQKA